eukprot:4355981-Pleurochrysis_carterae.AAC.2
MRGVGSKRPLTSRERRNKYEKHLKLHMYEGIEYWNFHASIMKKSLEYRKAEVRSGVACDSTVIKLWLISWFQTEGIECLRNRDGKSTGGVYGKVL